MARPEPELRSGETVIRLFSLIAAIIFRSSHRERAEGGEYLIATWWARAVVLIYQRKRSAQFLFGVYMPGLKQKVLLLILAAPLTAWGQTSPPQPLDRSDFSVARPDKPSKQIKISSPSSNQEESDKRKKDLENCRSHEIRSLPGSHEFASDFIETIATDPDPRGRKRNAVWALTADLSSEVSAEERALYISRSIDGGSTWTELARIDSRFFDAEIGEGLRNGLSVAPGGAEFVLTTQRGAFQILPQANAAKPIVKPIAGPRVPPVELRPRVSIPKAEGDPVRANIVEITPDGKRLIVGFGYFDLAPQIFSYHKGRNGSWIQDGQISPLPTDLDLLSIQLENSKSLHTTSLYLGTGDQAYRYDFRTKRWTRIDGVGEDSAIHSMTLVGGLHLAACWGVYNPAGRDAVARVTDARFLLHRAKDETGPEVRAYSIEVDQLRTNRVIITALTGVYTSSDSGKTWKRLNDLPEGEFRTAHFNPDGTVIISGVTGTFLANPFSNACSLHLRTRDN